MIWRIFLLIVALIRYNFFRGTSTQLANAIARVGPIFVKFGQFMAVRGHGTISKECIDSLMALQEDAAPVSLDAIMGVICDSTGKQVNEIFTSFSDKSIANGSIAQVHTATISNGKNVIVKVVKPGVADDIRRNIRLLRIFAFCLRIILWQRKLLFADVIRLFESTIYLETDMEREAYNLRSLKGQECCKTPCAISGYVYRDFCVIEYIDHIKPYNIKTSKLQFVEALVRCFIYQVFFYGVFHGDYHPGNIMFDQKAGDIYLVDFGIVGFISKRTKVFLCLLALSLMSGNYRNVVRSMVALKLLDKKVNVDRAMYDIYKLYTRFKSGTSNTAHAIEDLMLFVTRSGYSPSNDTMLIKKNITLIEGICKSLCPEVNVFDLSYNYICDIASHPRFILEACGVLGLDLIDALRKK